VLQDSVHNPPAVATQRMTTLAYYNSDILVSGHICDDVCPADAKNIQMWEPNSGAYLRQLDQSGNKEIYSIAINNDGLLASGGQEFKLWNISNAVDTIIHTFPVAGNSIVRSVAFNEGGDLLAGLEFSQIKTSHIHHIQ